LRDAGLAAGFGAPCASIISSLHDGGDHPSRAALQSERVSCVTIPSTRKDDDMFGTIARMKVLPGHEQEVQRLSNEWTTTLGAARGQTAEFVYRLDNSPNEYMLVVAFTDRDAYVRNANDPQTDRWYRQLREHLETDPEWNDGDIIQWQIVQPD